MPKAAPEISIVRLSPTLKVPSDKITGGVLFGNNSIAPKSAWAEAKPIFGVSPSEKLSPSINLKFTPKKPAT